MKTNGLCSRISLPAIAVVQYVWSDDVIVIGSSLAGMTAALTVLNRGGSGVLIEKEHTLGGNSKKASSGINACCLHDDDDDNNNNETSDTLELFKEDTTKSAGASAQPILIETLVENSAKAVQWLSSSSEHGGGGIGDELSVIAMLSGHSKPRTHRPAQGFVGAETGCKRPFAPTAVIRRIINNVSESLPIVQSPRY